jgi:hypothetical protein
VRDRRALPITRDYMAKAEAEYRKLGAVSGAPAARRRSSKATA